eukprot:6185157-Pleurochrysis_carterae.AAC.2
MNFVMPEGSGKQAMALYDPRGGSRRLKKCFYNAFCACWMHKRAMRARGYAEVRCALVRWGLVHAMHARIMRASCAMDKRATRASATRAYTCCANMLLHV